MSHPQQRTHPPHPPYRPPAPPFPEDPTTATRHLCAGAYLDDDFRNDALRRVYYQARRIVAPSYGFDAVPVLAHCLRARNGAILRDVAILVTVLVAACTSGTALFLALSTMAQLQLTVSTYRLVRDVFRKLRNGESIALRGLAPRAMLLTAGWILLGLVNLGFTLALTSRALNEYPGYTDLGQSELISTGVTVGGLMLAMLIFVFPVGFGLWRQAELTQLTPGRQVTVPANTARLDEIARQQRGNTTVYSGFEPHIGSGVVVDSWSFAQRLVHAEQPSIHGLNGAGPAPERVREFPAAPFDAQQLIDHVRAHLSTLLPQREAEEQIPGLTVQDRVCLAGTEVSHLTPYTPPDVIAAIIRHPTTPARHYLACQVFSWGGEIITTVYVHIAVQGRSLYLESTTTALPPCRAQYRIVDMAENNGPVAWLRTIKNGVLDTPRTIWRAPVNLAATLINLVAGSAGGSGERLRLERGYDYGARIGIRELGMDRETRLRTQIQDVDKYQKLIERRVFASVLDFLDDRQIDTTEYRTRAGAILNFTNGMNTFGDVHNFGTVKVGTQTGAPA